MPFLPWPFPARPALLAASLLALGGAANAAQPGDLISATPLQAHWVPSQAAQTYRLLYRTPNHHGTLEQGTGPLYLPHGPAPAGGWPVVSWAHGTQGVADHCAPSVSGPSQPERDGRFLDQFLTRGYAVAAVDYQGLGGPGSHAYLHVRTAADSSLDLLTASHRFLPNGQLSPRWVAVGFRRAQQRRWWPGTRPGPTAAPPWITAAASPVVRPPRSN
ncbi:MAG: hypothetical protein GAK31_02022 [Stenotrophomonas maltophilia]|uniref:Lipase n=1 Tax=Stenotrophomonas maltophilia TaxID=40324 RepID=A0A7V8JLA5_STEMA|nr:MAG: hypothetical protein GAK31_02022 [Stenotrophomonas maltophilia]